MNKWKKILIVSIAVISMIVNIGFSVFYVFQYSSRVVRRVMSDMGGYDHDFDEPNIIDDGYEEETAEEDFLRIDREMQAVADYLYTDGMLAGIEASDGIDTTFTPMMDAKGWPMP